MNLIIGIFKIFVVFNAISLFISFLIAFLMKPDLSDFKLKHNPFVLYFEIVKDSRTVFDFISVIFFPFLLSIICFPSIFHYIVSLPSVNNKLKSVHRIASSILNYQLR